MVFDLILSPYDSGHRDARMGRGPLALLAQVRAKPAFERHGMEPATVLEVEAAFRTEIGAAWELHRKVADAVAGSLRAGRLPILLSGNCNNAVGVIAGLLRDGPDDLGVVWFDGHGDCNTPETFEGDFLDAMALSTLTGRCWQAMAATVPGFRPLPDTRVVLIGGHGADDGALSVLAASDIAYVLPSRIDDRLGSTLDAMEEAGVRRVYVHFDADVLDRDRAAPANEFAPAGGLDVGEAVAALMEVGRRFGIAAATIASFDPGCDRGNRVSDAILAVLAQILDWQAGSDLQCLPK